MLRRMWKLQNRVLAFTILVTLVVLTGRAGADPGDVTAVPTPQQVTGMETHEGVPHSLDGAAVQVEYVDTDPSAVTLFRPELEPHGVWVEDPAYGLVWMPDSRVVGPDFVPYLTAGHWGHTAEGDWIWVSDYEWGWVVFHYGRWIWIPNHGWAWIPGRTYAPAWVVWRVGEPGYDYIGWAPMPPTYYWYGGIAVSLWVVPPPYYVYCETRYVFSHRVYHHRLYGHRATSAARYTRPYRPASPSKGGNRHAARPERGPSPGEARVPADAVPRTPATPHAKASSLAPARSSMASSSAARAVNRPSSRISGVSQPVYRGVPSKTVPANRRAAPLASRPSAIPSRGSQVGSVRGSRTLGSTTVPSRAGPDRGAGWGSSHPATGSRATPARPSRPATRPGRPSVSQSRGVPTAPSRAAPSRAAPSRAAPSGPAPSRAAPSYGSRPSAPATRPTPAPSRPSYTPSAKPSGSGQGSSTVRGSRKSNSSTNKSRAPSRARGGRR